MEDNKDQIGAAVRGEAVAETENKIQHDSDCSLHNMPAYPAGPCDCTAKKVKPDFATDEEWSLMGQQVEGSLNGTDWFTGELVDIIDFFAAYGVKVGAEKRYFSTIRPAIVFSARAADALDSQPKSIGDDAQFCGLLQSWGRVPFEFDELVAYIHEFFRAPADQAFATIQAAPEVKLSAGQKAVIDEMRRGWMLHSNGTIKPPSRDEQSAKMRVVSRRIIMALKDKGLIEFTFSSDYWSLKAATIQAPVMVAEPVDERALRAGRNLMDYAKRAGWPDDGEGAFEFLQRTFYAAGEQYAVSQRAAPMVADPAGVATFESVLLAGDHGKINDATIKEAMLAEIDAHRKAATVKAVPSEAVGEVRTDIERVSVIWYGSKPAHGTVLFAAPVADKTVGGE